MCAGQACEHNPFSGRSSGGLCSGRNGWGPALEFPPGPDTFYDRTSSLAVGLGGTVYAVMTGYRTFHTPTHQQFTDPYASLCALDGTTETQLWEYAVAYGGRLSSPVVGLDGTVYVGSGTRVYALDGATGQKRCEFTAGGVVESSPSIAADGTVYVGSSDGKVYALRGNGIGVLCVGWPGVQPATFKPGEAIHCRYRVWIHRGMADQAALEGACRTFCSVARTNLVALGSVSAQASVTGHAQQLRAEAKPDRVSIYVGDQLFTEYLSLPDAKYPYFYPMNGPRTGRSVTVRNTEPYLLSSVAGSVPNRPEPRPRLQSFTRCASSENNLASS